MATDIMQDASTLGYEAAVAATVRLFKSGVKAMLVLGRPGIGKTAMEDPICKAMGLKHKFRIKLSHHDVPDIAGVPVPESDKRTHFYPSADMLPPDDLTGGLLVVLDEIGDCNVAQQNLACQMVFEGGIHTYKFPPDTYFLLTSNRVSDRSGAQRIVTKLGNRGGSCTLQPTIDEVFEYGAAHGWNPSVLAFIKMHGAEPINPSDNRQDAPTYFNSFDPSEPMQMAKPQFSSSRSLEFVSNYYNYLDANEPNLDEGTQLGEVAAMVGTPVALKKVAFRKIVKTMPDVDAILEGKKVPYPTKQEVLWALALTLASRATKTNVTHIHAFLNEGPPEYLALAARLIYSTKMPACAGAGLNKMIQDPKLKHMFQS